MKTCLGFIILILSFALLAESKSPSKSTSLFLRGRVPASTTVEWDKEDPSAEPKIKFNGGKTSPRVEVNTGKDHKKITIIHP